MEQLDEIIKPPTGIVYLKLTNVLTGEIDEQYYKNVFCTTGKNSLAAGLIEQANKGFITYCALGTGSTTPTAADTTLETEYIRKLISVRSVSGNVATFTTFFSTSEGNTTLNEAGLFGDLASSTADSGTLFAHTAISRTKNDTQTLQIAWSVTIG